MTRIAIRGALVLLALAAMAYLAVGIRDTRLLDDGDAVLAQARAGDASPATVAAGLRKYDDVSALDVDPAPLIHSGQLLLAAGRKKEAGLPIIEAIRDEPDNIEAWSTAYQAARDPVARELAQRKLLKLNPWFVYVLARQQQG